MISSRYGRPGRGIIDPENIQKVFYGFSIRKETAESRGGSIGLRGLRLLCEGLPPGGNRGCPWYRGAGPWGAVRWLRKMRQSVSRQRN